MAQFILDCFPDMINEYGLIGCFCATAVCLATIVTAYSLCTRLGHVRA